MSRENFYKTQLDKNIQNRNSKILVLGAGKLDKKIFEELKYKNFYLSNIESSTENDLNFFNNLHDLKLENESYDYCVAHACIHHSSKPHNAILELYRVSSKGVLIIEANDSIISRLACKLGFSEEYEISAVKKNITYGGVDNSNIPNYVYRWTEREIIKLIKSFDPKIKHQIKFDYGYHIKFTQIFMIKFLLKIFFSIFPKQKNLMSIFINKNKDIIEYNEWIKLI